MTDEIEVYNIDGMKCAKGVNGSEDLVCTDPDTGEQVDVPAEKVEIEKE